MSLIKIKVSLLTAKLRICEKKIDDADKAINGVVEMGAGLYDKQQDFFKKSELRQEVSHHEQKEHFKRFERLLTSIETLITKLG